ncbi:uncharacterized protein LOC131180220 [Hevea brasiliensis]|uniref:uncharacterized protein LOC131180220 n=1 Tax=Hevea brasiliensis TaxID=3981 RepID=UPI0025E734D9|nr:uncharacterized protein LOC131180220 [Hevea brasiliensis]
MGNHHSTTGYSRLHPPPDSLRKPLLTHDNKLDTAFEKEVADLNLRIAELETLLRKQERANEAIKLKNTDLEKKILKLTTTIDEMKRSTAEFWKRNPNLIPDLFDMDPLSMETGSELDIKNPISDLSSMVPIQDFSEINNPVNDLVGCLIVLIFLVAMLIGVLL